MGLAIDPFAYPQLMTVDEDEKSKDRHGLTCMPVPYSDLKFILPLGVLQSMTSQRLKLCVKTGP